MLSLLILPIKILKSLVCSALKILILVLIFAFCALILNYAANDANAATGATGSTGVSNVHSFQKGSGTERNHTARC